MFGVNLTEKRTIHVARATVLFIAVIASILAGNPDSSVFGIVSFAGLDSVQCLDLSFLRHYSGNVPTGTVRLAGMIAGGVMVFVWKYCVRPLGGAWNVYELLPAFIVAMVVLIAVSLATGEPSKEIQDEFDAVRRKVSFLAAEQKNAHYVLITCVMRLVRFLDAECIEKKEKRTYNAH